MNSQRQPRTPAPSGREALTRALSDRTLPLEERLQVVEEASLTDLERVYFAAQDGTTQFALPHAGSRAALMDLRWEQVEPEPMGEPCDPDLARLLHVAYRLAVDNEYCEAHFANHAGLSGTRDLADRRAAEEEALQLGVYPYSHA